MRGAHPLAEGERVLLRRREETILLPLTRGPQSVDIRGVIDLTAQIGRSPGESMEWAGARYRVLRPVLGDLLTQLRRTAQIITPKDAQYLLYLSGVGAGSYVAEAGTGSGALTTVLAYSVGKEGGVVSYERRPEFLEGARGNLERFGLSGRVEFRARDVVRDGLDVQELDSLILDLPEPWSVAESARRSLLVGGHLATYTPTYNQLERTVRSLRSVGFEEIRSVELLERSLHVGEGGTRPEFDMLGHTGFLTGARRVE